MLLAPGRCTARLGILADVTMRRRFLLVHNPIAGVAGRRLVDRVVEVLQAGGATVTAAPAGNGGPDLSSLEADRFDAVIAAGGDGTFRAAAKVIGTRVPISFVPMGTGNVLAHEIHLPRGPAAIADVIVNGPAVEIEGALANGEPFFLMAGAGFDGEIIARLDTGLKRKIGKAAYTLPVFGALRCPVRDLDVRIDGVKREATWVVIANAMRYGGAFVVAPEAGLHRQHLIAVLFKSKSRLVRVRQLLAMATGLIARDPAVEMISCRTIEIGCPEPQAIEIDGDPFGTTPLQVTAGGPRARLIVPATYLAATRSAAAALPV